MSKLKSTVFKGTNREFTGNSNKEIAEHFGINYYTFMRRINRGYSIEEAIDWNNRKKGRLITVYKNTNKEFRGNLKEIANHYNISYNALLSRINRKNLTTEEAITYNTNLNKKLITVFKGTDKEFTGTKTDISKHFGIKYVNLQARLRYGYTIEEAINWNGGRKRNIITVFKNTEKEFSGNCKEISKHFDISYSTLREKIYKGFDIEESLLFLINNNNNKKITVFKNTQKEFIGNYKEIANHFKIDYNLLYFRIKCNYSIEQAICLNDENFSITVFKDTDREFTGNEIEIADYFKISYLTLINRLNNGCPLEKAIDLKNKKFTKSFTVFKGTDKEFTGNKKEIANHFNINYGLLISRLRRYSFEESIDWHI